MAFVSKVIGEVDKDPTLKKIGLISLEDIIEELLGDEIQDEYEAQEERNQRKILKEKLALYYTDSTAENQMDDSEFKACL